ncbi:MAG: hypothetical protein ACU84H_11675 [Gammaproteobacteria bacterium]
MNKLVNQWPPITALLLTLLSSACTEIKDAGRTVGHTARNVTREIGHGTRDVMREIGHGSRRAVKILGQEKNTP